jgi:hypothetical protein
LQKEGSGLAVHLKDAHVRPTPLGRVTGAPLEHDRESSLL